MLIPILIIAVLAIGLIFCLIKSSDTWNWIPITVVALIFVTAIPAGIAASRSFKARNKWMKQYEQSVQSLENAKTDYDLTLNGSPDTVDGYAEGSLRNVNSQLALRQISSGRSWNGGRVSLEDNSYSLEFTVEGNGQSPANQIKAEMQLYGFADGSYEGETVPVYYTGTFRVLSTDPATNKVVLEPLFLTKQLRVAQKMRSLSDGYKNAKPETPRLVQELRFELDDVATDGQPSERKQFDDQIDAIANGADSAALVAWLDEQAAAFEPSGTWSLLEQMPGDSRDIFKENIGDMDIAIGDYRNALRDTYLTAELVGMDPASERYETFLDEYAFDGQKLNEINQYIGQQTDRFNDDKFDPKEENIDGDLLINNKSEDFQVNSEGDGLFNRDGAANDPSLHYTNPQSGRKTISFAKETEIRVPKLAGKTGYQRDQERMIPLVERNDATWQGVEYFRRPIRDYPFQLREMHDLSLKVSEHSQAVLDDIATSAEVLVQSKVSESSRGDIELKLKADVARMEAELLQITELAELRQNQLNATREKIRVYYNQIMEIYKEMESSEFLDTNTNSGQRTLVGSR